MAQSNSLGLMYIEGWRLTETKLSLEVRIRYKNFNLHPNFRLYDEWEESTSGALIRYPLRAAFQPHIIPCFMIYLTLPLKASNNAQLHVNMQTAALIDYRARMMPLFMWSR